MLWLSLTLGNLKVRKRDYPRCTPDLILKAKENILNLSVPALVVLALRYFN